LIPFSDEELKPVVKDLIEKIRPKLALDGGDIQFLDVLNSKVFVQLLGACVGCSSSGDTLKYGVERDIRMHIHPELEVVNVPFGMENQLDKL
jgi:Fe-S cluster biogenesis protein NfuA